MILRRDATRVRGSRASFVAGISVLLLLRRGLLQSRFDCTLREGWREKLKRARSLHPSFLFPRCLLIGASVEERERFGDQNL